MSAQIDKKADRLLSEGAVRPFVYPAQMFEVKGDHGNYLVTIAGPFTHCTCPATDRCSHIEAGIEFAFAEGDRRVELEAAVEARKQRDAEAAEDIFRRLES